MFTVQRLQPRNENPYDAKSHFRDFPCCEVNNKESVTENNFWVMLRRARMVLRECLQINWFKKGAE